MRKKLVAGNWKMNLDLVSATRLAQEIYTERESFKCDVCVFPPFVFIQAVNKVLINSGIGVGAQNCSQFDSGAYTGEVSATMLVQLFASYVLVGHSERRTYFNETNEVVKLKMQQVLKTGLRPIFCCGEPLEVRNKGEQEQYVLEQLEESLFCFTRDEIGKVTIAYEPVWAIGTGLNATPGQAQQMHAFIRQQLAKKYSDAFAAHLRIVYGGSCKPDNAADLFACPDVDGGLIGGASLKAKDFIDIIHSV